jgi:hypothetical protein
MLAPANGRPATAKRPVSRHRNTEPKAENAPLRRALANLSRERAGRVTDAASVPGGRVSVRCGADPRNGAPVVEWLERGGPPIAAAPSRRGFGLRLLQRGLAAQAGMATDLRFEPEGLRCALRLPPSR